MENVKKELLTKTAEEYRDSAVARARLKQGLSQLANQAKQLARSDATELVQRFGELGCHDVVLETDDGRFISESVAICRYLEALHPEPPLFGRDPFEAAMVEMWIRRAEFRLWNPTGQIWINADPRTASVNPNQFKDYGEHSKKVLAGAMKWLDRELSDGREFLVGANYSMADIVLLCGIDFAKFIHQPMPDEGD